MSSSPLPEALALTVRACWAVAFWDMAVSFREVRRVGFLACVGWALQRGRVGRWLLCHCAARWDAPDLPG